MEELGEVARLMLAWEGYKEAPSPAALHDALEEELSDVFVFLFKLAYQLEVDVEAALVRGRPRPRAATMTWPQPVRCWRYCARQAEACDRLLKGPGTG